MFQKLSILSVRRPNDSSLSETCFSDDMVLNTFENLYMILAKFIFQLLHHWLKKVIISLFKSLKLKKALPFYGMYFNRSWIRKRSRPLMESSWNSIRGRALLLMICSPVSSDRTEQHSWGRQQRSCWCVNGSSDGHSSTMWWIVCAYITEWACVW